MAMNCMSNEDTTRLDLVVPLASVLNDEAASYYMCDGRYGRIAQASSGEFAIMRRLETYDVSYDVFIRLDGRLYKIFNDAKSMDDALRYISGFKALVTPEAREHWDVVSGVLWRLDDLKELKKHHSMAAA